MKNAIRLFVLAVAAIALTGSSVFAQATIHGDVVKDLTSQKDTMAKIVNAMPDDKFGFKPTPAQQTFAQRVLDVVNANVMLAGMLGGKTPAPMVDMKATTKAATLKEMNDSFDYAIAVANEFNNTTIQETVMARFLGASTRARVLFFVIAHSQDIYGQLAVYLRLNGVTPPASAGRP